MRNLETSARVADAIRRSQAAQPPVDAGTVMPLSIGYAILRQIKKGNR